MRGQRWQDWVNLVLGAWLFFSPFFGIGGPEGPAAWNSYIFGLAISILAALTLAQPQKWEEGVNLVIGLWLIVAPFALGFANDPGATWNHVIVGLLTGGDALWALLQPPLREPA
jgi:hypothetical protein